MDSLRNGDGTWKNLETTSPTGRAIRLYINRDRNPRQVKEDILGKRLQKIVAQQLEQKGTPLRCFYKKRDTTLFVNWQPVAKLIVEGPERFYVKWNHVAAEPLGLDREAVAIALDTVRESASSTQWSN